MYTESINEYMNSINREVNKPDYIGFDYINEKVKRTEDALDILKIKLKQLKDSEVF